jgi:hypothetical protein
MQTAMRPLTLAIALALSADLAITADVCSEGDETCTSEIGGATVKVWVGYQSKCPECSSFLNGTLAPVVAMSDIRAKLDLVLNVYGNTREYPIEDVTEEDIATHTTLKMSAEAGFEKLHQCHHGPGECAGNLIQACAQNILPKDEFVDLVLCMAAAMRAHQGPEDYKLVEAARQCFKSLGIAHKAEVFHCATSPHGNELLTEMGKKQALMFERKPPAATDADWDRPGVSGEAPMDHGPAVFINNEYLADNSRLLETVCAKLVPDKPKSCPP